MDIIDTQQPLEYYEIVEKNRGRKEKRTSYKYDIGSNPIFKQWPGVNGVIYVVNSGVRDGEAYIEDHYYITSEKDRTIQSIAQGIRKHWGIENKLHWTKDVILNEDRSMIRSKQAAKIMSWFKHAVISVLKVNKFKSIKYAIEKHANRPDMITKLIGSTLYN